MAKSILTDEKVCWFCLSTRDIHLHHIYPGTANRKISDKHGFTVYLCAKHHNMSDNSVHFNREMDLNLKKACQLKFEQTHSREEFIKLIGRSYL
jgi:hypothetical protein